MSDDGPIVDQAALAAQAYARSFVGRTIAGRYKIHEIIAMGGMATVFLGEHVHMRKRVAVKILHPDAENLPEMLGRFENESIVGAHVEHPNIASASDFGELEDGSYYLVLEHVRGITLHELIRRGPIPFERAVDIGRQMATALDAIHQMGILHRDLKPRNVMIADGARGVVKLIDFGLAKVPLDRISTVSSDGSRKRQPITGTGVIFGTVAYMAPEAALGMEAVTARSDLYALGIILYEMLAGLHPFDAIEQGALFMQQRTMAPPPFAERAPGIVVPPGLEAVVMKLLEKSPAARYESAIDVYLALGATTPRSSRPPDPAKSDAERSNESKAAPAAGRSKEAAPTRAAPPTPPRAAAAAAAAAGGAKPLAQATGFGRFAVLAVAVVAALVGVIVAVVLLRGGDEDEGEAAGSALPALSAPVAASSAPEAKASNTPAVSSAESRPTLVDGLDVAAWQGRLRSAPANKDWDKGARAIVALSRMAPASFAERPLAAAAADVATGASVGGGERAASIYDALASTSEGIDVLYELAVHRAGSKGAKRARELLRDPAVLGRGSPALRIALALREPGCDTKEALFERAASDGDARALGQLYAMHSAQCNPKNGECCFKDNASIERAIKTLRARLPPDQR